MAENFLTHKIGDIPMWGWGIAVVGGIGIAFYIRSRQQQAIPTGTQASNVALGNILPDQTAPTVAGQTPPNPGYINPQGAPTVPPGPGYVPIIGSDGSIVGWQYGNPGMQGSPPMNGTGGTYPTQPPPTPMGHQPGQVWVDSRGVTFYQATGNETINQIAAKLGLTTPLNAWNSIENLNHVAASYIPPMGHNLVI